MSSGPTCSDEIHLRMASPILESLEDVNLISEVHVENVFQLYTPEKWWLEDYFPFGKAYI